VVTTGFEPGDRAPTAPAFFYDIASCFLTVAALFVLLPLHLLPALVAGLSVYELVQFLERALKIVRIHHRRGKLAAVGIVAFGVVLLLSLAGVGIVALLQADNLSALLDKMADSIDSWRAALPDFIAEQLPANVEDLRQAAVAWLPPHAGELRQFGAEAGRTLAHIFLGLGIGVLISLHEAAPHEVPGPLAGALQERDGRVGEAFRRVVFSQVRIFTVNTILTALYVFVALPSGGIHLPLLKTMLVITFLLGLLPVVGNLISNTMIVILSLSISPSVAIASLVFLVVIHKLEYFLNAHLIGAKIQARAWELLISMLVMDAAFGVPGLVAAPIYYAYIKDELVSRRLV